MTDWWVYKGAGTAADRLHRLRDRQPPWRSFDGQPSPDHPGADLDDPSTAERGAGYVPDTAEIDMVNAALYLCRPLLVTGKPGTGKSTLAYSVADDLGLGKVLRWPVTSRSTLADALYRYDAIGRLHETNLLRASNGTTGREPDIGSYLRLGPLGTAVLPSERPRVLLIDEIDKSDIDLPNDLLTVLEEGRFEIPELVRLPERQRTVSVMTADRGRRFPVVEGVVTCRAFPIVIMTSNGEREFPPAFLRRCLRLDITSPNDAKLHEIIRNRLGGHATAVADDLVARFVELRDNGDLATDQLLNAIQLRLTGVWSGDEERELLIAATLRYLSGIRAI